MELVPFLKQRDLVEQIIHPEEFSQHLKEGKRCIYAGFDPTAESLHVGHLFPIMLLKHFQNAGHDVIALLGGGTAAIGDPTGKSSMRKMLDIEAIDSNAEKIQQQMQTVFDREVGNPYLSDRKAENEIIKGKVVFLNNKEWLFPLNYMNFLRDYGPMFSINRMMAMESVKQRMEKGLSFLEFNYLILQSYDFLKLFEKQKCTIQIGGNDQWSNLLGGVDLIRRKHAEQAYCMTLPLLQTDDGKKMGKTEGGAVWLDPNLTPPFEFFQFWRNVDDSLTLPLIKRVTLLETSEINEMESLEGKDINKAKERLAFEMTRLVHGEEEANKAKKSASSLFSAAQQTPLNVPEYRLERKDLESKENSLSFGDALVNCGMFPSKGELRRLISQNGLSVGEKKLKDFNEKIDPKSLDNEGRILIKRGKKHYYYLIFS